MKYTAAIFDLDGTLLNTLGDLTDDERAIILAGCLINYYRAQK